MPTSNERKMLSSNEALKELIIAKRLYVTMSLHIEMVLKVIILKASENNYYVDCGRQHIMFIFMPIICN